MAEFDYKEYARQLRENAVRDNNGIVLCSPELWEQIASIIENIPTADVEEVEWIDVNKRLPDEDGRYLVYRKFGIGNYKNIEVIRFENDSSYYKYVWNREVAHWRPLPEPPIEDGGKEE